MIKARLHLQVTLDDEWEGEASVTIEAKNGTELAAKVQDVRTLYLLQDALGALQVRVERAAGQQR